MLRITPAVVGALLIGLWAVLPLRAECVGEAGCEIPVARDVDVVVVGGSGGAVEAACEAARGGAKVFLLEARPYLGTDLCATLHLWLEAGEQPQSRLAVACFGAKRIATPCTVKAEMDKALLAAGVDYLTGCYATDVLRDSAGRLAGVVMANRSGRQAIRAKVLVDATRQALVARLAGAAFRPFRPQPHRFTRVVIGGELRSGKGLSAEKRMFTWNAVKRGREPHPVYEYTLEIDMADQGIAALARAEHLARDATWTDGAELGAELLGGPPLATIVGRSRLDAWPGANQVELGAFRPQGIAGLYVLSAAADLDATAATRLLRPLELMTLGARVGRAATAEAQRLPPPSAAALAETKLEGEIAGTVREARGAIPAGGDSVRAGSRALPIWGRYDVVVVGGGTSGAPAGIAAARSGAKTLVVEYLHDLGGVGTAGLITSYWYGLRTGYTAEVDRAVNLGKSAWSAEGKAEWLRRELLRCGADVWLGTLACGAVVHQRQVRGVVVATEQGRGAVLATTVVDATGNADVAAWAGAHTAYSTGEKGALNVQIAGFPPRPLGPSYVNTCYTMVDDTDVLDVWHLMVWRRAAAERESAFDVGQLVDSRERRRVVGDYTLTVEDILNHRTFPDTISHHYSNFDAAAFPDAPLLLLRDAKGLCFPTDLPLRCLLPQGLEGLLVVGLGAGAERDAMTLIRMQPDLQNQGYAGGVAAAAAAKAGGHTRRIDVKALQRKLVQEGVLDVRVVTDKDSYPLSGAQVEQAVRAVGAAREGGPLQALAVVLAHRPQALALLKSRCARSAGMEQLNYARVLGILGDPAGAPPLIAAVDAHRGWDRGAALTSQRNTGNTFSALDRLVIALGFSRAQEGLPCLVKKLEQLPPEGEMSHYKALSLALWTDRPAAAAGPLARLLQQPGFTGHATPCAVVRETTADGRALARPADRLLTMAEEGQAGSANLNQAMKELLVAALLYRCGDREGMAEAILKQYATDVHGHFARYARQALDRKRT